MSTGCHDLIRSGTAVIAGSVGEILEALASEDPGIIEQDGIVVLQDSRSPRRLHADPDEHGFFALSEEHRRGGVLPRRGRSKVPR